MIQIHTESTEPESDWTAPRHGLAAVFHRLAAAYESGGRFSDAARIYLHELSAREAAQAEHTKDIVHCLQRLAQAYDNLGNKQEANRTRLRASLILSELSTDNLDVDGDCEHQMCVLIKPLSPRQRSPA